MSELFVWTVAPLELFTRGTLIYLGLVACFRYLLRRDIGSMSTPDLLFVGSSQMRRRTRSRESIDQWPMARFCSER